MKHKMPIFLLLLMFISCNTGGNSNNENPEEDVIKIDADGIRLWSGTTETCQILSDGTFTVESLDPDIAQASVEDKTITVTATGIGRAGLLLKDGVHEDLLIRVFITLAGSYTEEHQFEGCAPKIKVVADDKVVAETILEELTEEMSEFNNCHYGFEGDGRFFFRSRSAQTQTEGTFSWDGTTLVLNYADKTESYSFKGITDDSRPRPYMASITLDLTDKYKARYPEAKIEMVSVERTICLIPPFYLF